MGTSKGENDDVPTQVRVRTDPRDGYESRYHGIQDAKSVFGVGNNTDAIVHATRHARDDRRAKKRALEYLADHLDATELAHAVDLLSTAYLPLAVETDVSRPAPGGDPEADVSVRVGPEADDGRKTIEQHTDDARRTDS